MKLHTDGERVGLETDPHDAEAISAIADIARSGLTFLDHLGVTTETDTCPNCGNEDELRPMPTEVDGEYKPMWVCGECQSNMVENRGSKPAESQPAEGNADDLRDRLPDDVPDWVEEMELSDPNVVDAVAEKLEAGDG